MMGRGTGKSRGEQRVSHGLLEPSHHTTPPPTHHVLRRSSRRRGCKLRPPPFCLVDNSLHSETAEAQSNAGALIVKRRYVSYVSYLLYHFFQPKFKLKYLYSMPAPQHPPHRLLYLESNADTPIPRGFSIHPRPG